MAKAKSTNYRLSYRCYAFIVAFLATFLVTLLVFPLPKMNTARSVVSIQNTKSIEDARNIVSNRLNESVLADIALAARWTDNQATTVDQTVQQLKSSLSMKFSGGAGKTELYLQAKHPDGQRAKRLLDGMASALVADAFLTVDAASVDAVSSEKQATAEIATNLVITLKKPTQIVGQSVELQRESLVMFLAISGVVGGFVFVLLGIRGHRYLNAEQVERELKLDVLASVFPTRKLPQPPKTPKWVSRIFVRLGEATLFAFACLLAFSLIQDPSTLHGLVSDPLSTYVMAFYKNFG